TGLRYRLDDLRHGFLSPVVIGTVGVSRCRQIKETTTILPPHRRGGAPGSLPTPPAGELHATPNLCFGDRFGESSGGEMRTPPEVFRFVESAALRGRKGPVYGAGK